ncbi:hypothetical protein TKK_0015132 [Trichogramma kaykai]
METLYTGAVHGFPPSSHGMPNGLAAPFDQDGVLSLVVVLGGSLSLVALIFAFITYRVISDFRPRPICQPNCIAGGNGSTGSPIRYFRNHWGEMMNGLTTSPLLFD